eukprot:scaffold3513_cov127-Isochrysis_galbana.AAC.2
MRQARRELQRRLLDHVVHTRRERQPHVVRSRAHGLQLLPIAKRRRSVLVLGEVFPFLKLGQRHAYPVRQSAPATHRPSRHRQRQLCHPREDRPQRHGNHADAATWR